MIARRQVGRSGRDGALRQRRAARLLRRQVRDDGAGQLHQAQGMIQQAPKGFNWAMFPLLKGDSRRTRSPTRRRSRSRSRASTRQRRCSSSSTSSTGENLAKLALGRLADPVEPGSRQVVAQVDEATGQLADRDRLGRPLQEGQLGLARGLPALEGGGRDSPQFVQYLQRRDHARRAGQGSSPTAGRGCAARTPEPTSGRPAQAAGRTSGPLRPRSEDET